MTTKAALFQHAAVMPSAIALYSRTELIAPRDQNPTAFIFRKWVYLVQCSHPHVLK